jgi:hypothetical protein
MTAKEGLKSVLLVGGVLAGWLVLTRVLFPILGVPT